MRVILLLTIILALTMSPVLGASSDDNASTKANVELEEKKSIQYREHSIITFSLIFRIILISAILLLFAFAVIYLIKRFYFGEISSTTGQNISVTEVKRITPKTLIYMINIHNKTYVLAQSADNIVKLDEFPNDDS